MVVRTLYAEPAEGGPAALYRGALRSPERRGLAVVTTADCGLVRAPSFRVAALTRIGPWKEDHLRTEFGKRTRWAMRPGARTGSWIFRKVDDHRWEACLEVGGAVRPEGVAMAEDAVHDAGGPGRLRSGHSLLEDRLSRPEGLDLRAETGGPHPLGGRCSRGLLRGPVEEREGRVSLRGPVLGPLTPELVRRQHPGHDGPMLLPRASRVPRTGPKPANPW